MTIAVGIRCEKFGRRSVIARLADHCYFSSSGRDYAENRANARRQISAFVNFVTAASSA